MEIPRVVRNADVVVVCLSSYSVTKEGYVQKEIKIALDASDEKRIGQIQKNRILLSNKWKSGES